jgi:NAD(P)-dependent dehydrogenase (short-subunit alcohol dehydrogenase family)
MPGPIALAGGHRMPALAPTGSGPAEFDGRAAIAATGLPQRALYSASKGAVSSLTLAMAGLRLRTAPPANRAARETIEE